MIELISNESYLLHYTATPFPYKAVFQRTEIKEDGTVILVFKINDEQDVMLSPSALVNGSINIEVAVSSPSTRNLPEFNNRKTIQAGSSKEQPHPHTETAARRISV